LQDFSKKFAGILLRAAWAIWINQYAFLEDDMFMKLFQKIMDLDDAEDIFLYVMTGC